LAGNPAPITLASAKLFRGVNRLLRFSGEGICLALNVPRTGRAIRLFEFLDRLVLETRSLPNLIKDSRLSQAVVAAAYPGYEEFRARLRAFDPQRTYRSNLSERLEL
jgi:decaprenylphospho-beta-D-ribofuranose 2-oxidase